MRAQRVEEGVAHAVRPRRHRNREVAHQPVEVVEARAIGREDVGGGVGVEALLDEPGRVVGDAVGACVEPGHGDQGDLELAPRQQRVVGEVEQQTHDVLERRRAVGKHPDLIEERPVFAGEARIERAQRLGQLVDLNVSHTRHIETPEPFTACARATISSWFRRRRRRRLSLGCRLPRGPAR